MDDIPVYGFIIPTSESLCAPMQKAMLRACHGGTKDGIINQRQVFTYSGLTLHYCHPRERIDQINGRRCCRSELSAFGQLENHWMSLFQRKRSFSWPQSLSDDWFLSKRLRGKSRGISRSAAGCT